jgi:hypothetical protein
LAKKIVPNYINIKIANTSPAALVTTKNAQITHIKDAVHVNNTPQYCKTLGIPIVKGKNLDLC